MNIQDFKQDLLENKLSNDLLVFVCPENNFLAETYIDEICSQRNLEKSYINTLSETTESALALVMDFADDLNILKVDTFNELADDYSEFKNCVVLCKKVDKVILEQVKDYIVEIPKLVDWQVIDYMKAICPGLDDNHCKWLYTATGKNIYKIKNELDKISLVDKESQGEALIKTGSDLFVKKTVFELVDALINNNANIVKEVLQHVNEYSSSEIDPIGLTTLTLAKLKNILLLNYKSGVKESDLGLSNGAIWHIKNDNRNVPVDRISKAITFLSNIDSRLKSNPSSLDFIGNRRCALLEYIVLGTLACGR